MPPPQAGAQGVHGLAMHIGAPGQWWQPQGAGKQQNGLKAFGWTQLNLTL
jgi:hypothetical protein